MTKQDGVEVAVETIKPVTAQDWLLKNTSNRKTRERVVEAYARDMAAGRWRMSGEPIKFAKSGQLLDGQHRLHAVMMADVPVSMLVIRGLDENTQSVMDTGAPRTAGDALRLRGETAYYSSLAAAARMAILMDAGQIWGNNIKVTNTEILDFVDAHPDLRRAVELTGHWRKAIDVPPSILCYATWRLLHVDPDDCILFFSKVADKTELTARDPILALNNRLTEIRRNGRRVDRGDYLSLVFRAWNYWRTRKHIAALPVKVSGGSVDIPEPK